MYALGRPHADVYESIVATTLDLVRRGLNVCLVSYGHPAVFDRSSHEAIRRARAEGFRARILPGVSAEDCLFVDLEMDPGESGLQSFDAVDFLLFRRNPDTTVPLVLWQISVIGETHATAAVNRGGLKVLADRLEELYGGDHEVVVYETSPFPVGRPLVDRVPVRCLPEARVTGLSTLFVPPGSSPSPDPRMVERLTGGRTA
jgi:uncharacterized protein YabN with tetrapyrrole methylase and pyrophosphatase domain